MTVALALVGCGGMGRRHLLGMKRLQTVGQMAFDLTAVCDVLPENGEKAAALAEDLLGYRPQVFKTLDEMIRTVKLDAIIITTTPETHTDVGLEAFAAGLHVMAEKPITLTVAQGTQLVEAGKQAGRKLAVAENYRRDPINRLGKALLDAGAVGRPFLMNQASSGAGEFVIITPWRHLKNRGGIVIDMGVHYADILEYYLGLAEHVVGMNAVVDKQRIDAQGEAHPADAEDLSVGVARHRNGVIANWLLSMAGRGESLFARTIYGTGGSLGIPSDRSGKALKLVQRRGKEDVVVPESELLALVPDFALDDVTAVLFGGQRLTSYELPWADIDANLLGIEQADFVDAILHDREPEVSGVDGLRSLAMVFGFLESERLGRIITVDEVLQNPNLPYQAELNGVQP
jgi:predicted dehydrogenase